MAATVVSVVIFLCGVLVGRDAQIENVVATEGGDTTAGIAAAGRRHAVPGGAAGGPPAAEPPAPAAEPDDELSYAKRLQADAAPAEKLKPRPPAPPRRGQAAPPPSPAPPASAAAADADAESGSRQGAWIVQVVALQDRGAAAAIVTAAGRQGLSRVRARSGTGRAAIYRVQVGALSRIAARPNRSSRRLEKEEQFKPLGSYALALLSGALLALSFPKFGHPSLCLDGARAAARRASPYRAQTARRAFALGLTGWRRLFRRHPLLARRDDDDVRRPATAAGGRRRGAAGRLPGALSRGVRA